jgi:hypothetical protein
MRGSIFDLNIYNHILQFVDGRGLARWMRTCKTICAHIRANPTMVALIEARVIVCDTAADMIFSMIGDYTLKNYIRFPIPKIEMRKYLPLSNIELKGKCYMYDNTYYILNVSESLDISQVRIARALEKFNPERFKFICTAVRFNHRCANPEHRHTEFHTCLRFQDTLITRTLEYPEMDGEIIENWRKKRRIQ